MEIRRNELFCIYFLSKNLTYENPLTYTNHFTILETLKNPPEEFTLKDAQKNMIPPDSRVMYNCYEMGWWINAFIRGGGGLIDW